jgi:hypothetical protein
MHISGDEWPPGEYSFHCTPCAGEVYWHLHCRDERVNGGLACDDYAAAQDARDAAWQHRHGIILVHAMPRKAIRLL